MGPQQPEKLLGRVIRVPDGEDFVGHVVRSRRPQLFGFKSWVGFAVCGRVGIVFGKPAEVVEHRVLVDVVASAFELCPIEHKMVGEAALPGRELRRKAAREASLDVLHSFGDVVGCHQQMDVVWHDDEGIELVEAFATIMLEGFEEELCVRVDLEQSAAVVGDRCDEKRS
jgi:hypothetical protein